MNKDGFMVARSYLKANDVVAARATPFDRVTVSKTSAGMIQAKGRGEHFSIDQELWGFHTERAPAGESEIENPRHNDKAPVCTSVVSTWGKPGK